MKKLLLLSLFVAYCGGGLLAQSTSKLDATQVIEQVLNTKVFIDYANSKKAIENQLLALNKLPRVSAEDYATLQNAYGQTKAGFDNFLNLVRQDMIDFQLFEKAANGDEPTILRYLNEYNAGVAVYNREFQPVYDRVVKTRGLKDWLEPLALQAFNVLGSLFKGKNPRQDLLVNDLLLISKKYFLNRLEMKTWEALVRIQPTWNSASVAPPPANPNTLPPATAYPGTTPPPAMLAITDTLLEEPVMKTLSGSLEFIIAGNPPRPMDFAGLSRSLGKRNLVVGEADPNAAPSGSINIPVFQTVGTHGEGTAFQIRVQNSALLYAFALNSDGKCAPIYPFNEAWVLGFQMSKSRNLSVGPLMLQDATGNTTIPAKNANTGAENYIKISGLSSKEQLCLILSKSEIDLQDVIAHLEQLPGSLAERVAALWQSEPHRAVVNEAGLVVNGSNIQFNVQNETKWLLPMVFEIQR